MASFSRSTAALLLLSAGFLASRARADVPTPRARPVVAIVALNGGTETTDFLVPFGVMTASDAVEVHAVSTGPGPVQLHPALTVESDETIESFDAGHPGGADFVIVPAVHDPRDARLVGWLEAQSRRGATLVAICDGIWPVAATGVLDGRRATAHWYSLDDLESKYPKTHWVRDRRYVRDGPVMSTTGVTASIPASLALVEEIAGPTRARAVAEDLGIEQWNSAHESARFSLSMRDVATAARNWLGFWRWETVGIPVAPGTDEIALGLLADSLARTYRSTVLTVSTSAGAVRLKHGIRLLPDTAEATQVDRLENVPVGSAAQASGTAALDHALTSIARVHGNATADFVALQLEYPARRRGSEQAAR